MPHSVCVILVTHNRKSLLRESLAALRSQSHPVQTILVVDNASTDGTAQMLAGEFPDVAGLRLDQNLGGAGGYYAGIAWAMKAGFEWFWLLDDDTIADRDTLANLFDCRRRFRCEPRPDLLASKVVWTDGSLHPMNIQKPKLYDPDMQMAAALCGAMSIRFTSFVSMLMHRRLAEQYGLPIAGYFVWNDDVEYTARILRREFGVVAPASVVTHKTAMKYVPATSTGAKIYYEVRNKLWIVRLSKAFDRGEKWWMAKSLARRVWRHLRETGFAGDSLSGVSRGIKDGLGSRPAPNPSISFPMAMKNKLAA